MRNLANIFSLFVIALFCWYTLYYLPTTDLADFGIYRSAARELLAGNNIYTPTFHAEQGRVGLELKYLYPPLLAVVLSWLEPLLSQWLPFLWCLTSAFSVVLAGYLASSFAVSDPTRSARLLTVSLFIAFPPTLDGLMWGQVNAIVFVLIIGAYRSLLSKRNKVCGLLLGIAALLKGSPVLLLLPFMITLELSVVVSAAITGIIGSLLCCFSPRGVTIFQDFFHAATLLATQDVIQDPFYDYSFKKLLDPATGSAVGLVIISLYVSWLAIRYYQERKSVPNETAKNFVQEKGVILGIPTMIVTAPCVWFHHLVWLLLPISYAYRMWETSSTYKVWRMFVFSIVYVVIGLSLYLHVFVRYFATGGEPWVKVLIPILVLVVGALSLVGIEANSLPHSLGAPKNRAKNTP